MSKQRTRHQSNPFITFDKNQYVDPEMIDLVTLWILRVLIKLGGFKEFIDKNNCFSDDKVAYFLELDKYVEDEDGNFSRQEIYAQLVKQLELIEKQEYLSSLESLEYNLDRVSGLVGLNEVERKILRFVTTVKNYKILDTAMTYLGGDMTAKQTKEALSAILNIDYKKIEEALSLKSTLSTSSLIHINASQWISSYMGDRIEVLNDYFVEFLFYSKEDIAVVLKDSVRSVQNGMLEREDYDYIDKDITMLYDYLRNVLKRRKIGVNILFYGVPGTGKTELAITLAKMLEAELYEVGYIDEDEGTESIKQRLKAYRSAQALLKKRKVLLMYDEAEDIFDTHENLFSQKKQQDKACINHMIRSNTIPTIWITNDISSVDPAIVRRFDIVLEMQVPKRKKRIEILKRYSKGMLNKKILNRLAKNPHISPAVMQRAICVAEETKPKNFSKMVYRLIDKTLKAQKYPALEPINKRNRGSKKDYLPAIYDPALLHTDTDLEKLADSISKIQNARLCFYGLPGTGKSAYGRYIAKKLGRKVIVKKGSDLLSKWVGGTEQNIAASFKEAKQKKAVLIFDEVDGFLQDRSDARANWETTQVNEMLTQIEGFEGIFIATTNLLRNIDKASLRRFDMKLEFKPLKLAQTKRLLQKHCKSLGMKVDAKQLGSLQLPDTLTPGDFAAVIRQHRFNPIESVELFVGRLKKEVEIKGEEGERKMGFV